MNQKSGKPTVPNNKGPLTSAVMKEIAGQGVKRESAWQLATQPNKSIIRIIQRAAYGNPKPDLQVSEGSRRFPLCPGYKYISRANQHYFINEREQLRCTGNAEISSEEAGNSIPGAEPGRIIRSTFFRENFTRNSSSGRCI